MRDENTAIDRRRFVTNASLSLAAASLGLAAREHASAAEALNKGEANDRILALRLQTATPLKEMRDYHCDVLGLEQARLSETELEITAGRTRITFVRTDDTSAAPFYHFAFNIPENKVKAAHDWQAARGPLMPTPTYMQDPQLSAHGPPFSQLECALRFLLGPCWKHRRVHRPSYTRQRREWAVYVRRYPLCQRNRLHRRRCPEDGRRHRAPIRPAAIPAGQRRLSRHRRRARAIARLQARPHLRCGDRESEDLRCIPRRSNDSKRQVNGGSRVSV